jgi:hypothetical protein
MITAFFLSAQDNREIREGEITFISSQNIYVQFESTAGIEAGDSLYIKAADNPVPVIIVKFISSKSAAGESLNGEKLEKGDIVFAFIKRVETEAENEIAETTQVKEPLTTQVIADKKEKRRKERINGRITINSLSGFNNQNDRDDIQRWRYSLSLNADNFGESNFSFSSYINFSYKADEWNLVSENLSRALKIYNLAIKYDAADDLKFTAGREINRRVSNLGPVDGLQAEKLFGNYFAGLIAGSRPHFTDMGFNLKLFQYGGYFGRSDSTLKGWMESSAGFFQQTNDFKTDRRFIYLQHNNSAVENLNLFFSSEIDLYKKILDNEESEFSLTSLFISARYSPHKILSFSTSYDARKNVIYYETFKNFIDSLFENETRQGLRIGTSIRPMNNLFINLTGGLRFSKSDVKKSSNYNGNVVYTNLPFVEGSLNISLSQFNSSFFGGMVYGFTYGRNIDALNLYTSIGWRRNEYSFERNENKISQNSLMFDLSLNLMRHISLSASYEGNFHGKISQGRLLFGLTGRL